MARSVGGIVARLYLNDTDFRNKINRASVLLKKKTAEMRSSFNDFARRGIAVATVALAGFSLRISQAMEDINQISKTSARLSIPVESLQTLYYWANQSSVEISKLEIALQKASGRIGQVATTGSGTAAGPLERLNLDAKELIKLDPAQQFSVLMKALDGVADHGERIYLAEQIFSRGGVDLLQMLEMGADSFDTISEQLEKWGIVLDEVGSRKVVMAGDAITDLKIIQDGWWNQMTVLLSPAILQLSADLQEFIEGMGGMDEVAFSAFNPIVQGIGYVGDAFWGLRLVFEGVRSIIHSLQRTGATILINVWEMVDKTIGKITDGINYAIRQINRVTETANKALPESLQVGAISEVRTIGESARFMVGDFLKGMEEELAEQAENSYLAFAQTLDKGNASQRIKKWFDRAEKTFTDKAKEAADQKLNADKNLAEETDELADLTREAADKMRLTIQDIAGSGLSGSNVKLAERAAELRRQERAAEIQGRFGAADRLSERAAELESRIRMRTQGGAEDGAGGDETQEKQVRAPKRETSEGEKDTSRILQEILLSIRALPDSIGVL